MVTYTVLKEYWQKFLDSEMPKGFIRIWEVALAFHPSEVDQTSTINSWGLTSKSSPLLVNPIHNIL